MKLTTASVFAVLLSPLCLQAWAGPQKIPGEYLVKLKHDRQNSLALSKLNILESIELSDGQNLYLVKADEQNLLNNFDIEIAEPNLLYNVGKVELGELIAEDTDPQNEDAGDPLFSKLWGLKNTGFNTGSVFGGTKGMDINATKAWEQERGSREVVIAVIDTGINYNHPDLKGNVWVNQKELNGVAGIDDDGNGVIDDIHGYNAITNSGDPLDDHGHGSHCSGTIAATHDNGIGVKGVMADAQIMGIKFLSAQGSGTLADAIKAIDYATKMRVYLMSNSWGGGGFSELLKESIERASQAGIVFVAAAGNASNNNDRYAEYPAGYDLENVISVAAHQGHGAKASFSNFGEKTVHVAAPGTAITSTVLDGKYQAMSGTSMATPHVSGAIGLLLSQERGLTPSEVRERVIGTSIPVGALAKTCQAKGRLDTQRLLLNTRN